MLWQSVVPQVMAKLAAEANKQANQARKTAAAKALNYYHDQQLTELQNALKKKYADPDKLLPYVLNLTRKVTNLLASTYMEPPTRTLEGGTEKDADLWSEIVEAAGMDAKLKTGSRYVKLLKTILVRPVWRGGRVDFDLLTPNVLDVEIGDSPEDLRKVLITHYGTSDRIEDITYSLWTPAAVEVLNYRGQVIDSQPNPYQVLPFVPCWDRAPVEGGFWQSGGEDLIQAQDALNQLLTSLCYTLQMQGFGVGFIKGSDSGGGQVTVGAGTMLELPADGEVGFAKTNAPVEEIVAALDWLLKQTAVSYGLPASSLTTKPTEESGVSKIVSNFELQDQRRDDIAGWRRYEKQIFSLTRTIWNHHNPDRKLSDKATLKLDFADPQPPVSETEEAAAWTTWIEMGVASPVDVLMARNPDLKTREDALAHLLKVRDELEELQEKQL